MNIKKLNEDIEKILREDALDRIKTKKENKKALQKKQEEETQKNYINDTVKLLKDKDYFNTVWKKYKFSVKDKGYEDISDNNIQVDFEIKAENVDAGISVEYETWDDNTLRFIIMPYDFSTNTDNLDEPFIAYDEWYEAAFNKKVDTVQVNDYDQIIKELERITNKSIAKKIENKIEESLEENYDKIVKILNK